MKSLTLRLDPGEQSTHPMHSFVAEHAEYGPTRLLQWNPHAGEANVLLFHVSGPEEPFLSELDGVRTTDFVDTSTASGVEGFYLYVRERSEGSARALVDAYAGEDIVLVPPVVYEVDGSIRLTAVGSAGALQRTLDETPTGTDVSVQRIRSQAAGAAHLGSQLTDRQREVVATAIELGYYEEPRAATVAEVADRLACAPGTVAEHLRKAESTLVRRAVETAPGNE